MAGWREMLLDVIKLTDTVAAMNYDIEKLDKGYRAEYAKITRE